MKIKTIITGNRIKFTSVYDIHFCVDITNRDMSILFDYTTSLRNTFENGYKKLRKLKLNKTICG